MQIVQDPRGGGTDLLSLAEGKMAWAQARQQVLAQNVANADTPGYVPRDISPFQDLLSGMGGGSVQIGQDADSSEHSIDGNQVSLDHEMEKIADTNDQQHMAVNLYKKYLSMFQTVLGK